MATFSARLHTLQWHQDDSGAELVEWVVVVSIIVGVAAGLFVYLGPSLGNLITDLLNSI